MKQTSTSVPHAVAATEHLWIVMPDGCRLAARMWLPVGGDATPCPAILEYIPYRKADMVRARDERNHPYFASHGFACLRVDMRGSGDSEGQMPDMYSDLELSDARHVIDWIAGQPWCNGRVGMFGTSWGGTASLQANIDAPDALKAVIAVCATHDRFEDDIHHMGGCLITDTFEWGATLPAILAAPPTPNVGPEWKRQWVDRLDQLGFPVDAWVRNEARGRYWRHGSVIHQAERLSRPVLAVGGWSDRYSNSVMSLVAARPDLVWGLVGPWGHHYPDQGHPGPAAGFQQLALDWWTRWLKPETDLPPLPRLRVWLREFDPPEDALETRNGNWIETGPPQTETHPLTLTLAGGKLTEAAASAGREAQVPLDLTIGGASGDTGYFGRYGGLPLDQQEEDAASLVFETEPLQEDVILYGAASLRLLVRNGSPLGQMALRLNDVDPDGASARVCLAIRNLALDDELDATEQDGARAERTFLVPFHTMAYRFRKGHRIRLAISSSYWPMVWPSPALGTLTVRDGALTLPRLTNQPNSLSCDLPAALDLPVVKTHVTRSNPALLRFQTASEDGNLRNGWEQPYTETYCSETETAFGFETRALHSIRPDDPTTARSEFEHHARYIRTDGTADIQSELVASCDPASFLLHGRLTVDWNGERLAERAWQTRIPRTFG